MFKRIDRSPRLAKLIEQLSTFLARRRGLPVIIGIALIVIGFIIQLIAVYVPSQFLEVVQIIAHNVGLLAALIGLLVAEPLGK
jgi:hypothetical protein